MKGSYLLILNCTADTTIAVGKLGFLTFKKGFYLYVGSAMNSLEKRISRHFSKNKKLHWHIDFLTTNKSFKTIKSYIKESSLKEECLTASKLQQKFPSIKNFGSTDCSCQSHLFRIPENFSPSKNFLKTYKLFLPSYLKEDGVARS